MALILFHYFMMNLTSVLSDLDLSIVWPWPQYCLTLTSVLSDLDLSIVWPWPQYCLTLTSVLSDLDLSIVWPWPPVCVDCGVLDNGSPGCWPWTRLRCCLQHPHHCLSQSAVSKHRFNYLWWQRFWIHFFP